MVIAIDYTPAYEQGGGIGRLVRDQVAALAQIDTSTAYRLFVAGASSQSLSEPPGSNFAWCSTRISATWLARLWHRARIPLPVTVWTGPVKLYHATNFVLPPVPQNVKTILTIHDVSYVRVPEAASPRLKVYLDRMVPDSIRRADHVIADSAATKADLIELYNTPPEKISVLLSSVDPRFSPDSSGDSLTIRNKYHIEDTDYLFAIGTVQPRKNYSRIIHALKVLRQQGYELSLVIAGGKGWLEDEMYQTLDETEMQQHVKLIGFADDEDLPALYREAACVVFPSLYEGFGFPVLESMACGTPVITSNVSSLPEVAGDAALMVDPLDTSALIEAIRRVLDDEHLRQTMIKCGLEQVKRFTPQRTGEALHRIYSQVLSQSKK